MQIFLARSWSSGKSADCILHREPHLLKDCSDAMGDFKN
jgi:hypothetical protein